MTPAEHYAEAERIRALALAQVHATLALYRPEETR